MNTSQLGAYSLAHQRAAVFQPPQAGCLRITGADRVAFLQRQTTNDVTQLQPGRTVLTVLTSPSARILDVLYLLDEKPLAEDEPAIYIVPLPGLATQTYRYLKSRIFFMDQVRVTDLSIEIVYLDLLGPQAEHALRELGLEDLPGSNQSREFLWGADTLICLGLDPQLGLGWRLIFQTNCFKALTTRLKALDVGTLDAAVYDALRIEAGLPAAGFELTDEFTPLETGLVHTVSQSKGCYTGQEVLARQVNYEKVTQTLCGLLLDQSLPTGQQLYCDGRPAGKITSVASSPRLGWIALAVVKRPFNQAGIGLSLSSTNQVGSLKVCELPFSLS